MSPDEFDLRNALREGEGAGVDPDVVIARAVAYRHARRARLGSIAAGIVAVAAIGVGGATLLGRDNGHQASEAARTASRAGAGSAGSADSAGSAGGYAGPSAKAGPRAQADAVTCPAAPPRLMLPGGGGSGQFGSAGSLFSGAVESVEVCGYAGSAPPAETVLGPSDGRELAASMDAASTRPIPSACIAQLANVSLVVYAFGADGKAMDPVVVSTCGSMVTNGTAIRYGWSPPASLTSFLASLSGASAPSGKVSGSPAR